MKQKIGNDDFCIHCMEWREFDNKGRCVVCKNIIHKETKKNSEQSYNNLKSESTEDTNDEYEEFDY